MSTFIPNYEEKAGGWHVSEPHLSFGSLDEGFDPPVTEEEAIAEVDAAIADLKKRNLTLYPNERVSAKRLEVADGMVFMRLVARSRVELKKAVEFLNQYGIC